MGYHTTYLHDAAIVWPKITASGTKTIRNGGSSANNGNPPPSVQAYVNVYNDILNHGYTPIIQISFDGNVDDQMNFDAQTDRAKLVVAAW